MLICRITRRVRADLDVGQKTPVVCAKETSVQLLPCNRCHLTSCSERPGSSDNNVMYDLSQITGKWDSVARYGNIVWRPP